MRLPVNNPVLTSDYGERVLNGRKEFHQGLDYISKESNNVYAIADGIVVYDFDDYEEIKRWTDLKHSAGNYLIIQHNINGKSYYCRYLHLGFNLKEKNERVKEGEIIGKYGDYGISYGPHLHWEAFNDKWVIVNPHEVLG